MIHGINDDKSVRYEVATEILNARIAINTHESAEEEAKTISNEARIAQLAAQRERLVLERRRLSPDDRDAIDRVYAIHAPLVRARQS